ncbi:hypothetical protein ACFLV0_06670 [Chloroflexota bacterium]
MPTILMVSEDFVIQSKLLAKKHGISLKHMVFKRSIEGMPPEEIEAETDKACEGIARLLSESA